MYSTARFAQETPVQDAEPSILKGLNRMQKPTDMESLVSLPRFMQKVSSEMSQNKMVYRALNQLQEENTQQLKIRDQKSKDNTSGEVYS